MRQWDDTRAWDGDDERGALDSAKMLRQTTA